MSTFRALIKNCGFFDIGYSGPAYTWHNRQHTTNPIYQRLDRYLVNLDWCAIYPNTKVLNLPIILSDHAQILISTDGQFYRPKQSFKFENWWLQLRKISILMLRQPGIAPSHPLFLSKPLLL